MKRLLCLLLLAAAAPAEDGDAAVARIREELARGAPREALALAERALGAYPKRKKLLTYLRAQAQGAVARGIQREQGYLAAIEYLEQDLSHPAIALAYGELCLWAGEEERGLAQLRRSKLSRAETLWPECNLLALLRRYDEIGERARAVPGNEWAEWARREETRRQGLLDRTRRGAWTAAIAGAVLLLGCALLYRLAPPRP